MLRLFRSGRIYSINLTEEVSEAIRETSHDIIGAALVPHRLDKSELRHLKRNQVQQRETTRKFYRENDERLNEEELYQEKLRIFGLNSAKEESKNVMSD